MAIMYNHGKQKSISECTPYQILWQIGNKTEDHISFQWAQVQQNWALENGKRPGDMKTPGD